MNSLFLNDKLYLVPGSYDELSSYQVKRALQLLNVETSVHDLHSQLLSVLLNLKWNFKTRKLLRRVDVDGQIDIRLLNGFFFQVPKITENKIEKLVISRGLLKRKVVLFGPIGNLLSRMTFLEWIKVETYYRFYLENVESEDRIKFIDKILAIFYRPMPKVLDMEKFTGDYRMEYIDDQVDIRLPLMKKVSYQEKYAFLYYLETHREEWQQIFDKVYGSSPSDERQSNADGGLLNSLRTLAGGALNMEEMGRKSAEIALFDLNKRIEEYHKLKQKNK